MPISVRCPSCGKGLTVPDHAAGKRGKCPSCQKPVAIPAGPGAVKAAPARPAAAPPMAAAAAPAAAQPTAPSGGGAGTSPKTFKKLFLYAILGPVVGGLLLSGGMMASFAAVVSHFGSEARKANDALEKAAKEAELNQGVVEIKHEVDTSPPLTTYLGFAVSGLGGLIAVLGYLAGYALIYKEWALIQDGQARTTPMMAIIWLLPVLNIYGIFVAIRGLAEDLNNYAKQRGIQAREVPMGFVTTTLVLMLVPCTSGIGILLLVFVMNSLKNAAVDIATAKYGAA